MEPILTSIAALMVMILCLLIFNSKLDISMKTMAWTITLTAFISMFILMLAYSSHPECYDMINHNNLTLVKLQESCYQYINF